MNENIDWVYVARQVRLMEANSTNQDIIFDCLYRIGTHAELFDGSNFGAKQRRETRSWISANTHKIPTATPQEKAKI